MAPRSAAVSSPTTPRTPRRSKAARPPTSSRSSASAAAPRWCTGTIWWWDGADATRSLALQPLSLLDRVVTEADAMDGPTEERPRLDATKLQALLDSVDRLTSTLSMDNLLEHILAIGQGLTSSQAGSVILHDEKRDDLYFAAATGPTADDVKSLRIPVGKGKAGTVFTRRLSIIENDIK